MHRLKEISVQYLKGVGPARKKLLQNLGVETIEDLLYLFPRRYEDRTRMTPLSEVKIGEYQTVTGKVHLRGGRRTWYTKKHVFEITVEDKNSRIFVVWFNQPYLEAYFKVGQQVVLYGKVDLYKDRLQMVAPEYEIIESDEDRNLSVGRIVPIYPLTRGFTQRYLRKIIHAALERYREDLRDILPVWMRNKHRLFNIRRSIENIHYPESFEAQEGALGRISFEEFFLFQLSVIRRRMSIVTKPGIAHAIALELIEKFSNAFPFKLTGAQGRVIREIAGDMQKTSPMLRLLQGDVGSGKTLVALFGCVAAWQNGKQAAIMAPTEILARQHCQGIQTLLAGGPFKALRVELLVGGLKKQQKDALHKDLADGKIHLLIGTHALLSEDVAFKNLSFIVIDEQHKFGVGQRALLSTKGTNPDILVMTATPIPRTLGLTLYGDLDISTLDEMPLGRGKVTTKLYNFEKDKEAYATVRKMVEAGQQAYIVYPIIEESETLDLKAAQAMFRHFQKEEFKGLSVGLVHGQMKRQDAEDVMEKFKKREISILVATTVLEVGVDVPNANIMVIEHAERFGLSQLHQLRGRIGRGKEDALCILLAQATTEEAEARLKAILSLNDGFKIAEQDLLIRGPGHYFGRHQHGLNELKFANPLTQIDILEMARKEAQDVIHKDPDLSQGPDKILKEIIQQRYPTYLKMVEAG